MFVCELISFLSVCHKHTHTHPLSLSSHTHTFWVYHPDELQEQRNRIRSVGGSYFCTYYLITIGSSTSLELIPVLNFYYSLQCRAWTVARYCTSTACTVWPLGMFVVYIPAWCNSDAIARSILQYSSTILFMSWLAGVCWIDQRWTRISISSTPTSIGITTPNQQQCAGIMRLQIQFTRPMVTAFQERVEQGLDERVRKKFSWWTRQQNQMVKTD